MRRLHAWWVNSHRYLPLFRQLAPELLSEAAQHSRPHSLGLKVSTFHTGAWLLHTDSWVTWHSTRERIWLTRIFRASRIFLAEMRCKLLVAPLLVTRLHLFD